jgi:two-component system osmolarity sensor histidine kinase EnvZ
VSRPAAERDETPKARHRRSSAAWRPTRPDFPSRIAHAVARRSPFALSLFSRTFLLLALLLGGGIFAWVLTLRQLELEPRAVQAAREIAALVNLSRAALRYSDPIDRVAVVKTMSEEEAIRVMPREPGDTWEPYATDRFTRRVANELRSRLEQYSILARSVNGQPGLWVGFTIEHDAYWLHADAARIQPLTPATYFVWVGIALAATLLASAAVARWINRPLQDLSFAASRIRDGEYDSRLDEDTMTHEIRQVNMGFNRMARELARIEEDRAVMLAGISHDLRTPLARLRLETEMSVADEEARRNMAADIDQLDAIIDKFMDYARPGETQLKPVPLSALVDREIAALRETSEVKVTSKLAIDLMVLADETELGRVFGNLFENARRYARGPDGFARVEVTYHREGPWVVVSVRDHGPGVPRDKLPQLTTPFFRGDAARTEATGAGLGLAIVEKAMQRMGGSLELDNAEGGGFVARLRLRRVT